MKKSVVLLTILLLVSIAGTYAVYELYVKQRMKELGEHLDREQELRDRIAELEDTFYRTQPPAILKEWRESTQPWAEAVEARTEFFNLGGIPLEVDIPEEVFPKLYYQDELPKLREELENYAYQKNVGVADFNCGVPAPNSYGQGTDPSAEEIAGHLEDYKYCAAITRMLIDAGPQYIEPLVIWPEREIKLPGRGGVLKERTVGVRWDIRMEDLVKFIDQLRGANRYFRIEALRISNRQLLQADPVLKVEMLLTQAYFVPTKARSGAETELKEETTSVLQSLFGGGGASSGPPEEEEEESWWQWFRRNWLPF